MYLNGKILSKKAYVIGVLVLFAAVYSQYVLGLEALFGFVVVYGIPIIFVSLIFGRELFKSAGKNGKSAIRLGMGLFGVFTVVGIFLSFLTLLIILSLDPEAINLLNKPNPVLQIPQEMAWVMVAVSILVVGPSEEYLFRGFVYGGLLSIFKGQHWLSLALVSSLLFASVHGYYVITYGIASAVPLIDLVTFGMAMAMTFYLSRGNLVAPALIHGIYDATGFLGVATSMDIGLAFRGVLIAVGLIMAVVNLLRRSRPSRTDQELQSVRDIDTKKPMSERV